MFIFISILNLEFFIFFSFLIDPSFYELTFIPCLVTDAINLLSWSYLEPVVMLRFNDICKYYSGGP